MRSDALGCRYAAALHLLFTLSGYDVQPRQAHKTTNRTSSCPNDDLLVDRGRCPCTTPPATALPTATGPIPLCTPPGFDGQTSLGASVRCGTPACVLAHTTDVLPTCSRASLPASLSASPRASSHTCSASFDTARQTTHVPACLLAQQRGLSLACQDNPVAACTPTRHAHVLFAYRPAASCSPTSLLPVHLAGHLLTALCLRPPRYCLPAQLHPCITAHLPTAGSLYHIPTPLIYNDINIVCTSIVQLKWACVSSCVCSVIGYGA